jgi:hypothetical protein
VERVGVIDGCGVRVGKGLGVVVIVQVGSGVRVGRGVGEITKVGVSVGWVAVAVKEAAISATAASISNVGGIDAGV